MQITKFLNEGSSCHIFECFNPELNECIVAKVFKNNFAFSQLFFNEVKWMLLFKHSSIISYKGFICEKEQKMIFFEKCQWDLFDYLELFELLTFHEIKEKMKSIFKAVHYIHHHKAAHCDIKVENIGITSGGNLNYWILAAVLRFIKYPKIMDLFFIFHQNKFYKIEICKKVTFGHLV